MLKREHYETGYGCNDLQEEFRAEYGRPGVREIFVGDIERDLLSIVAMPKPKKIETGGKPRFVTEPLKATQPIVDHREVEILMVLDRQIKDSRPRSKRIEILAILQKGFLDEDDSPSVGGFRPKCCKITDFTRGPVQPYQAAIRCPGGPGDLKCIVGRGMLRVRRIGDGIDICVGDFPKSKGSPIILYRLPVECFQGDNPSASVAGLETLPEHGQTVDLRVVTKGEVLVTLHRTVTYMQARFDGLGQPLIETPRGKVLSASHGQRGYFALLNKINRLHNDLTLLPLEEQPMLVDPDTWAWGALFEFPREIAMHMTKLPEFEITQALKSDFMEAIGPNGAFYLHADRSGVVADINPIAAQPHLLQIRFQDGGVQNVPASAVLWAEVLDDAGEVSMKMLSTGDKVTEGQCIGYPCAKVRYATWEMVEAVLEDNLYWMLEEFLRQSAIFAGEYGWKGPNVLVDWRYALPVISHAALDPEDRPLWHWDFREAVDYLDENGNIVPPPIRRSDAAALELSLRGILFFLGEPEDSDRQQAAAKRRNRRRRRKEGAAISSPSDTVEAEVAV